MQLSEGLENTRGHIDKYQVTRDICGHTNGLGHCEKLIVRCDEGHAQGERQRHWDKLTGAELQYMTGKWIRIG